MFFWVNLNQRFYSGVTFPRFFRLFPHLLIESHGTAGKINAFSLVNMLLIKSPEVGKTQKCKNSTQMKDIFGFASSGSFRSIIFCTYYWKKF